MKFETGKTPETLPSLSCAHKILSELQDEFAVLTKRGVPQNERECRRLVESIREHLHRARVLLLSTNIHDGLPEIRAARDQLDRLTSLLSARRQA